MSEDQRALIARFFDAFQRRDADAMLACYSADVVFSDPVFGTLRGADVGDMWRMLTQRAQDFSLRFEQVRADGHNGSARWTAHYRFGPQGRAVINHVSAAFVFRDGLICRHDDYFDLWRWSRQALGAPGWLLGWSPLLQRKVRHQAYQGLRAYQVSTQRPVLTKDQGSGTA